MINKNYIIKLVEDNKWKEISSLFDKKDIQKTIFAKLNSGNYISHVACAQNNKPIVKKLLTTHPDLFIKLNDEGESPLHVLLNYGYFDLLKYIVQKEPSLLLVTNDNNNTVLYNSRKYPELFVEILDNIDEIRDDAEDLLNHFVVNDNSKAINAIMKKKINPIYFEKKNPSIVVASQYNNLDTVMQLLKNGVNPDKLNNKFLSAFIYATLNKNNAIASILIDSHADINYCGPENSYNPLIISFITKNYQLSNLLIDKKFALDKYDKKMNTPIHIGLSDPHLPPDIVIKLIFYGDMNIKNKYGITPLKILLSNHNWRNYNKILEVKEIDIFDSNNIINTINNKDYPDFINMVAYSFINKLSNNYENIKCDAISLETQHCVQIVKEYMIKNKTSVPKKDDGMNINNQFKLIENENKIYGLFNSDTVHGIIYTIGILKKYPNLCIPYQYYSNDLFINEHLKLSHVNFFLTQKENIIPNLIKTYQTMLYEMVPYLILFEDENKYHVNQYLHLFIRKCFRYKIRFILFKLTIISTDTSTHANIILFDKETGIMERFEPYGDVPFITEKIDDVIKNYMGDILKDYLQIMGLKFTYLSPKDYVNNISFQSISDDGNIYVKKLGDPEGYCLAWTFWYIEMRLSNPNVHPQQLVNNSIKNISEKYAFIDFIRNYSKSLDDMKNKMLLNIGISKNNLYNLSMSSYQYKKISDYLTKEMRTLITQWEKTV